MAYIFSLPDHAPYAASFSLQVAFCLFFAYALFSSPCG